MPLSSADRLGPYEIVSPLGAGGMGEVYKARDPRLDRTVALKISKAEFTERFSREARTVAQLNHPHICTLHDVGPNYLVMEFVDGQPLRGPLPLDKALEYAAQILDALDAAHRKGIVHRDLKPANILLTKQGIKLLDFGLAKVDKGDAALGPEDITIASGSMEGQISGTLQYMSPEQLEGKPVDARSDIFSFGLVLYELITGKRPFNGPTHASIIASILREQAPPVRSLQPLTPTGIEEVLQTCLEKDPDNRWQSAREVKHALQWVSRQTPAAASQPVRKSRRWLTVAAVLALLFVAMVGWVFRPRTAPQAPVIRFQTTLPQNVTFSQYLALSPDGRKLVANTTNDDGLWVRDLSDPEWRRLPGTEGALGQFWSPDSRFVGFSVQNAMKKIDLSGGPVETLGSTPNASSSLLGTGSWNRDGVIIFGGRVGNPIWKISQAGGTPTAITNLDMARGETFHSQPFFMPDGKHFIYFRQGGNDIAGIYGGSLDNAPSAQPAPRIVETKFAGTYANGYIFFIRDATLMAQPFDEARLQLKGEAVPVVDRVARSGATGAFSVSPAGVLVYRPGPTNASYQLTWFDRGGKPSGVFGQPGSDQYVSLSPDGTRGVVRDAAPTAPGDLWTVDFTRGVRTRFTFHKGSGSWGVWSPDGNRIAFSSMNLSTLYEKPSSGGEEKELWKLPSDILPTSWSRDGRFILCYSTGRNTGADLWVVPLEGAAKAVRLLATEFNELEAAFSPDMRWVAYASNESGRYEIYVRPFIAAGPSGAPALGEGKWQVSRDGGGFPRWIDGGKQIVFATASAGGSPGGTMVADVKANGASFEAGTPEKLFQPPQAASDFGWDITQDGKRFVMAEPLGVSKGPAPFTVVLNWPTLLKKN